MLLKGPQHPASRARHTNSATMALYGFKKYHIKDHRFWDKASFMMMSFSGVVSTGFYSKDGAECIHPTHPTPPNLDQACYSY